MRQYRYTCLLQHTPLCAVTAKCSRYVFDHNRILSPKGWFLYCVAIEFSERYIVYLNETITKFCNLLSKFLYQPDFDPVKVETV
jgi:hypothetical protein